MNADPEHESGPVDVHFDAQDAEMDEQTAPRPVYACTEDWVSDYFVPMFRRTLGGEYRWCAQWWQHAEAISRLSALWQAWEVHRLQPGTGISLWYREHLDHHLPILMGPRGPFYQCSEDTHREPHEAALVPAPDGWWDTTDDGTDPASNNTGSVPAANSATTQGG